ncbi:MAG: DUF456 domain-containing protein [Anaerolinea sp.]|nr:DUF456 domain-containing protein [Anaerolinea sp.]
MSSITQPAILAVGTFLLMIAFVLSFIPILPGAILVWAVAVVTAILNHFIQITPLAVAMMTIIMAINATSDIWLPMLGVRTSGLTCLGAVGSMLGGLVGTFVIPLPILGTLIGTVIGALAIELIYFGEMRKAFQAGRIALKLFIVGYILEMASSAAIVLIFLVSLGLSLWG